MTDLTLIIIGRSYLPYNSSGIPKPNYRNILLTDVYLIKFNECGWYTAS